MLVEIQDARLFVEVLGPLLKVERETIVERPTVVFLHGGPGFDHMSLRPDYESLSERAQLVFFDHRGNGRSSRSDPGRWTLAQWSRDVAELIAVLGLKRPIVFGQSFGGIVAQRFAIDYPESYSGLVLSSTLPNFDLDCIVQNFTALHGVEMGQLARRYFTDRTDEVADEYNRHCFGLYTVTKASLGRHSVRFRDVAAHFFSRGGEGITYDFREDLQHVRCPVLLISGARDPVVPRTAAEQMAKYFAPGIARSVIFENCGHGPARDRPDDTHYEISRFLDEVADKTRVEQASDLSPEARTMI